LGLAVDRSQVVELASGAAAAVDGHAVFDPGSTSAGLGAAIAWAMRQGARELDLIAEPHDDLDLAVLARQARWFDPAPRVWSVEADGLRAVEPAPFPEHLAPPPDTAEQMLLLEQAGLDVVVEHGAITGELRGLEIARVATTTEGVHELHVGVGRFDQEASALMQGDLARPAALSRVVELVGPLRSSTASPHPVNRLVRERWLRHQLVADPGLVGLDTLEAVDAPERRGGLRDTAIAVAIGRRADGTPVVVVTSEGTDLEVVPRAADARAWHAPDAELVVVLPEHNVHPVTQRLADQLARPARVLEVAPEWPR
jgi:hypothetical protein